MKRVVSVLFCIVILLLLVTVSASAISSYHIVDNDTIKVEKEESLSIVTDVRQKELETQDYISGNEGSYIVYEGGVEKKRSYSTDSKSYLILHTTDNRVYDFRDKNSSLREGSFTGSLDKEITVLYDDGIDYSYTVTKTGLSGKTGGGKKISYSLYDKEYQRSPVLELLNKLLKEKEANVCAKQNYEAMITAKYPIVTFGNYDGGDGLLKGAIGPVNWLVLKEDGQYCLLLSEYIIDSIEPYNRAVQANKSGELLRVWERWGGSYIRSWLNPDFYNDTFTEEEKAAIRETTIVLQYPDSKDTRAVNEETTADKLFLLSVEEVEKYLPGEYAFACELEGKPSGHISWLTITEAGSLAWYQVTNTGFYPFNPETESGIRPAMWVSKDVLNQVVSSPELS